jgi:hypothetical protein
MLLCPQTRPREHATYPVHFAIAPMDCQIRSVQLNQYGNTIQDRLLTSLPASRTICRTDCEFSVHDNPVSNTHNFVSINDRLQPMCNDNLGYVIQLIAERRLDGRIGPVICKGL